MRCIM